jgi:hypothetical protein
MKRLALALTGLVLAAGCGVGGVPAAEAPPVNGDPVPVAAAGADIPVSITIPKLGVTDDIVPVTAQPSGAMEVPPVEHTGWWSQGPRPGDPGIDGAGAAVVLSHVNFKHTPGAFARLSELRTGDAITVTDRSGTVHKFVVKDRRTFEKDAFAENYDFMFADTGTDDLVAVTCGGALVGHSYDSNVVVRAAAVT